MSFTIAGSSPTHCHCGAEFKGSDHCPHCGCEQYEAECNERQPQYLVFIGRSTRPVGGVALDSHHTLGEMVAEWAERGHAVRVELDE